MRSVTVFAFSALVLVGGAVAAGCSPRCGSVFDTAYAEKGNGAPTQAGSPASGPAVSASTTPADASRVIREADIIQLDHEQNYVYAMSKSGSLAIVDASQPRTLTLLGTTRLSGEPFEMYRRGQVLLTMSNYGVDAAGAINPISQQDLSPSTPSGNGGALISAVDVSDPAKAHTLRTLTVPGEIADSRVVGDVLYLATFENGQCYGCAVAPRTLVTSFDIKDPLAPKQIDQVAFAAPDGSAAGAGWATPWKRSIIATKERLYVGGLSANAATSTDEGIIEVLDITDPGGHLARGAKISTSGPIMSRWQMDEYGGVLRVISQRGASRSINGEKFPDIDTFRIESTSSMVRTGHTTMTLPRQEALKTVRFDGPRAYAITFETIENHDPLFTFDLSDAAHPVQTGDLQVPGWIFHLEPRGDRLLGLGLDRTDPNGSLNVSLVDVSNLASPTLVSRVAFGPVGLWSDGQITDTVLAEDQDRIQKALRVFDDGLIAIPFSASSANPNGACQSGSGVQLMEWTRSSLSKQVLLPVAGNPRRAIRRDSGQSQELIAVSDSNVTSFAIEQHASVKQTADVVIGTCVLRVSSPAVGGMPIGVGDDMMASDRSGGSWDGTMCH